MPLYQSGAYPIPAAGSLGWADALFVREAANVIAQRNGASAQQFNVYNTYTDGSNYELGRVWWSGNNYTIDTISAGTGTARNMQMGTRGTGNFTVFTNGTDRWKVDGANGHFLAASDAVYDIGASGATRPRNLYISGYLAAQPPSTQSGTTYSVSTTDYALIFTAASTCTVTLPAAASFSGRQLRMKGTGGATVVSASSNVVPKAGGSAGTAILAAAAGSWAELISDGTNWIIMAGA